MLVHYIIVRRDLPLGVLAAMITHAAGESGALYQDPDDGRFRHATAVVLEVKKEQDLHKVSELCWRHNIQYVEVWESGGPYDGQFMAVGIVPGPRSKLGSIFGSYQALKALDIPEKASLDSPDAQMVSQSNVEGNSPDLSRRCCE